LLPQAKGVGVPISQREVWGILASDQRFRNAIPQAEGARRCHVAELVDALLRISSGPATDGVISRGFRRRGNEWRPCPWPSV